ncbi:unnamed protein product, partial [Chrysoparadoxa australica]
NGAFSVSVTQNNCTDTSACYTISTVGLSELSNQLGINLYPNPSNGQFQIDFSGISETVEVVIYSVEGKLLERKLAKGGTIVEFGLNLASGKYMVSMRLNEKILITEFVVE